MSTPDESDAIAESIPMPAIRLPSAERKIHVPRVAEITGRESLSQRAADREWHQTRSGHRPFEPSVGKPKMKAQKTGKPKHAPLNTTVLHEQRRPKRWRDYGG